MPEGGEHSVVSMLRALTVPQLVGIHVEGGDGAATRYSFGQCCQLVVRHIQRVQLVEAICCCVRDSPPVSKSGAGLPHDTKRTKVLRQGAQLVVANVEDLTVVPSLDSFHRHHIEQVIGQRD